MEPGTCGKASLDERLQAREDERLARIDLRQREKEVMDHPEETTQHFDTVFAADKLGMLPRAFCCPSHAQALSALCPPLAAVFAAQYLQNSYDVILARRHALSRYPACLHPRSDRESPGRRSRAA